MSHGLLLVTMLCATLAGCGRQETQSPVTPPGAEKSATTVGLEAGARLLQNDGPLATFSTYLDGFHFYSGRMNHQMEAHHYCSLVNDEVFQCVIFDGNTEDAKVMGVEYIISGALFAGLEEQEKRLWHSHRHEVASGQLVAPNVPAVAEKALMQKIATTYGKTWHTWHTDQKATLPLGIPALMMGFTQDGQADPTLVAERDRHMNIDSSEKRRERADLQYETVDPGADAWQRGSSPQLELTESRRR